MPAAERIGSYLKRAEQSLNTAKNAALKPAGVTVSQYAALLFLSENPGISAAALARLCGVTPPTMNTVLGNLQDRGLIERTPHAWHKNILETALTEKGRPPCETRTPAPSASNVPWPRSSPQPNRQPCKTYSPAALTNSTPSAPTHSHSGRSRTKSARSPCRAE